MDCSDNFNNDANIRWLENDYVIIEDMTYHLIE